MHTRYPDKTGPSALRPLPLTVPTPSAANTRHYQQHHYHLVRSITLLPLFARTVLSSSSSSSSSYPPSSSFWVRPGCFARDRERRGESRVPRVSLLVQVRDRVSILPVCPPPPHPATCLSVRYVCSLIRGGEVCTRSWLLLALVRSRVRSYALTHAHSLVRSPPPLPLKLTNTPAHRFYHT